MGREKIILRTAGVTALAVGGLLSVKTGIDIGVAAIEERVAPQTQPVNSHSDEIAVNLLGTSSVIAGLLAIDKANKLKKN